MAIVLPKFSRRRSSAGLAAEAQPAVNLTLCRESGVYKSGENLTVKWRISRVPLEDVQGIEVSVLWHTEGKGDEDLHVHHFHRLVENQIRRVGLADEQSTHCVLPATPLSYHGKLVSVRWCIRLRLFLANGREIVTEHPFHLISPQMASGLMQWEGEGVIGPTDPTRFDSPQASSSSHVRSVSLASSIPAVHQHDRRAGDRLSGPTSAT